MYSLVLIPLVCPMNVSSHLCLVLAAWSSCCSSSAGKSLPASSAFPSATVPVELDMFLPLSPLSFPSIRGFRAFYCVCVVVLVALSSCVLRDTEIKRHREE